MDAGAGVQGVHELDDIERRRLLDLYRDGARDVAEVVALLSLSDLDRRAGGEWSAREVIHHIADAELIEGVRLRRIVAEDSPLLPWIDEEEHARRLHYERAIETSVDVFGAVVLANAALAARLSDDEWLRTGRHSVSGTYSVEDWLRKMSQHAHDHAAQMLRAAGRGAI
jgi:hypothetical protein